MRICIVGYGKMGKEIERVAKEAGHEISAIVARKTEGRTHTPQNLREALNSSDVAIDFTTGPAFLENLQTYLEAKVPVVVGTTGWHDRVEDVKEEVESSGGTLLYSPNFSIGVNLFLRIIERACMLDAFGYDVALVESHHNNKKDYPSGTALRIAELIIDKTKKDRVSAAPSLKKTDLNVCSLRCGNIFGEHTVVFDSEEDTIELIHRAKGRKGFAVGAIRAAEWLVGRKGFFTMDDYISDVLR